MMDTRSNRWINFRRRLIGLGLFVIASSASADDPAAQAQQALPPKATAESPWQQVMPKLNEPMAISPAISIALSPHKPSDLKEKATYRGGKQSYGYVRAGDPDSVRLRWWLMKCPAATQTFTLMPIATSSLTVAKNSQLFLTNHFHGVPQSNSWSKKRANQSSTPSAN